jgi:sugar-specific transcriptional regulator TrmB
MTSAPAAKEPEPSDEDLAAAGLSRAEVVAYEQIITRPGSTARELAGWWTRLERLQATIAVLQSKGLVTDDDAPPRYTAVDPAVALEAPLLDYEDRLQSAQERARQLADRHRGRPRRNGCRIGRRDRQRPPRSSPATRPDRPSGTARAVLAGQAAR